MTFLRRDLIPRPRQAKGYRQAVLVAVPAQGRLRLEPEGHNEVAVEGLPDVRRRSIFIAC